MVNKLPVEPLYDPLGDRPSGDLDLLKKNRERMTKAFQALTSRTPIGAGLKLLAPTAAELGAKAFKFTQDTFGDISKRISLEKANDIVSARLGGMSLENIKKEFKASGPSINKVLNEAEKQGAIFPLPQRLAKEATNRQKATDLINYYNTNNIFKTNADIAKEAGFASAGSLANVKIPVKLKTKFEVNQTNLQNVFNDEVVKGNMKLSDAQFYRDYLKKETGIKTDPSSLSALFKTMPNEFMTELDSLSRMLRNPKRKRLYDPDMTLADYRTLTGGVRQVSPAGFGGLPKRVMDFARRSVNAGNKDIEFLVPPRQLSKNSFDYSDTVFKYKGQTYNMQRLIDTGYKDKNFSQIKNLMDDKTELLNKKMINPITGEESKYGKVASKAFNVKEGSLLQIDHLDIAKDPFSNLRLLPGRINVGEGSIRSSLDYDPVATKMGYKFTKDKDKLIKDEINFVEKVIRGQRDPVTAVEAARKNIETRGVRLERKDGGLVFDPNDYIEYYSDGTKLYKIKSFIKDIAKAIP